MTDLHDKRIFLSGPMTGIKHYNVSAFVTAHAALKERGASTIYNPALNWLRTPESVTEGMSHADWMRVCISELTNGRYDLLVQLPGWEKSEGARIECEVARACGIRCVALSDITDSGEPTDG